MCKFHKDVARDIAIDPTTDQFDPGKYAVALVALAHFRIEQYMPTMHGIDGFVPAQMVTDAAVTALSDSSLRKVSSEQEAAYRNDNIGLLYAAMALTAQAHDLSMTGLNIPDNLTRGGYKHCAKMPADPTQNGPFMNEAVVDLFTGYDRPGYVSGNLILLKVAHKPAFEPIRAATEHFMTQSGVAEVLQRMFEGKLSSIFMSAQEDLRKGRGFQETAGCVMCEPVRPGERKPGVPLPIPQPEG